jgi:hypothetical protein
MRSPEDNVPEQVRPNVSRVLSAAVNVRNRAAKKENFCSETSEDAVTWTVISFLMESTQIGVVVQLLGLESPVGEPVVSLWGAPLRQQSKYEELCEEYVEVSNRLGEDPNARSEPDVIVAWRNIVVLIEVKHTTDNPVQADYRHFDRYLDDPAMWSVPMQEVKRMGLYELARNWRLGIELAGTRAFALINLGSERTRTSAECFEGLVRINDRRLFRHILWSDFLGRVHGQPPWLKDFLVERGMAS